MRLYRKQSYKWIFLLFFYYWSLQFHQVEVGELIALAIISLCKHWKPDETILWLKTGVVPLIHLLLKNTTGKSQLCSVDFRSAIKCAIAGFAKMGKFCFSTPVQISRRVFFYLALPSLITSKYPIYSTRCVHTPCHPMRTRAFFSITWSTRWHWQLICKHWLHVYTTLHNYAHSLEIYKKKNWCYKSVILQIPFC